MPSHCRMRGFDRDLIRGGHYGQRSCEPHLQAEHMAALTQACVREESPCQPGAVHTWHFSDMLAAGPACPLLRDDRTQLKRTPTSVYNPQETFDLAVV